MTQTKNGGWRMKPINSVKSIICAFFIIGTFIAAWPDKREERVTVSRPHQAVVPG